MLRFGGFEHEFESPDTCKLGANS